MKKNLFLALSLFPLFGLCEDLSKETVKKVTIKDALASSYNIDKNKSARDKVKSTHEQYIQARAAFLPTIKGSSSFSKNGSRSDSDTGTNVSEGKALGLTLNQNIFNGGASFAGLRNADAQVYSAWSELEQVEQESYKDAASAYLDVLMQKRLIDINKANLDFVTQQYENARQKHEAGEETITNVEAAKAEMYKGEAAYLSSVSDLETKKSDFYAKTNLQAPSDLSYPEVDAVLPKTIEVAQARAEKNHYSLKRSLQAIKQAESSIDQNTATILPSVDFSAGLDNKVNSLNDYSKKKQYTSKSDTTSANFSVTVSLPLFEGGANRSKIRASIKQKSSAQLAYQKAREDLKVAVLTAWNTMTSMKENVEAYKKVVEASKLALNSTIEEQKAGSKTLLDVLDQQKKYSDASNQLVNAENKYYKACYDLLDRTGLLNAKHLKLDIEEFDPSKDYEELKKGF